MIDNFGKNDIDSILLENTLIGLCLLIKNVKVTEYDIGFFITHITKLFSSDSFIQLSTLT